ncbi:MAG: hypothetical protein ACOY3P_20505 [Planctomycetota bacterium]
MARVVLVILIAAAGGFGGYVYYNYRVDAQYDQGRLVSLRVTPRPAGGTSGNGTDGGPASRQPTFRIATFHVEGLNDRKLANRRVGDVLLKLLPQFQLVALQGLEGDNLSVAARLTEQVSLAAGRPYDYAAVLPRAERADREYTALLFDQTVLEIDRTALRSIEDAGGRFRRSPLAALFRTRGPKTDEAFTFQVISLSLHPDNAPVEAELLDDVFRAVRDDGRGEDDVLLLGDFVVEPDPAGPLAGILDLTTAIQSLPTTLRGTRRADNIYLMRRATSEFSGRSDVVDLMRAYDLTFDAAREISEHLPVWAEFSVFEGGQPGHVAAQPVEWQ